MMAIVEGPPGAGKSFNAVRRIALALDKGQPVASNIALVDGWEMKLAKMNPFRRLIPGRVKAQAKRYTELFVSLPEIDDLMKVRTAGTKEGRAVMVLDEAHVWLNGRMWKDGDRKTMLRFFSAHRHLGWDVYLVTQRAESIDTQVRALAEYRILLRNLKRVKVMGLPIVPFNFFVAIWTWEAIQGTIVKRETYRLNKIARLYNTLALAAAGDLMPEDPIWLPHGYDPIKAIVQEAETITGTDAEVIAGTDARGTSAPAPPRNPAPAPVTPAHTDDDPDQLNLVHADRDDTLAELDDDLGFPT